jgi:hypothetical protein
VGSYHELWLGGRMDADGFQILGREGPRDFSSSSVVLGGVGFCVPNGEHNQLQLLFMEQEG